MDRGKQRLVRHAKCSSNLSQAYALMYNCLVPKDRRFVVKFSEKIPFSYVSLFFNHLAATNVTGFSETLSLGKKSLSLAKKSLSLAEKFLSLGKSY